MVSDPNVKARLDQRIVAFFHAHLGSPQ
jgi:hypothetical protein